VRQERCLVSTVRDLIDGFDDEMFDALAVKVISETGEERLASADLLVAGYGLIAAVGDNAALLDDDVDELLPGNGSFLVPVERAFSARRAAGHYAESGRDCDGVEHDGGREDVVHPSPVAGLVSSITAMNSPMTGCPSASLLGLWDRFIPGQRSAGSDVTAVGADNQATECPVGPLVRAGTGCDWDTPAFGSYMGHSSTNSGAFPQWLSAFRDWELTTGRGDMPTMAEVARMIAATTDPDAKRRAMQEAFHRGVGPRDAWLSR